MPRYTKHIPAPCDEPVQTVFADHHLLVIVKPSGLLSVPGRYVKDCVLHRVLPDYPDARIVHRLDLDTSGLMVQSLSDLATRELNRRFRERQIEKEYIARVFGVVSEAAGEICLGLRADPDNRPRQLIDDVNGKHALTRFRVLESCTDDSTTLLLIPVTGRSHQLRVHTAAIGHPILGCDLYAHEQALAAADRLMLHASKLRFTHPLSNDPVEFTSEPDFLPLSSRP